MLIFTRQSLNRFNNLFPSYCSCASLSVASGFKRSKWKPARTSHTKGKSKGGEPHQQVYLGRVGASLKIGIVGVPNVGKSTLFNALTDSQVACENFPFCTIDPNESRVAVRDERFDFLCDYYKPKKEVPAFLKVVDIAGLIAGASEGKGLGNAFLGHISACDAIFHVVRAFDDADIVHFEGNVDPVHDLETILAELLLKDIEYFNARFTNIEKKFRASRDEDVGLEFNAIKKFLEVLEEDEKQLRFIKNWNATEVSVLNHHLPLTAKPIVYLANLSKEEFVHYSRNGSPRDAKGVRTIQQWIDEHDPGAQVVPFCSVFEESLKAGTLSTEDETVKSMLPTIVRSGLDILHLHNYFTGGKDEVKAWTIQRGTKAPQAAGRIHSQFESEFIACEVMNVEDLMRFGNEEALRAAGKYFSKGKEYVVADGDIVIFKSNVTPRGSNKKESRRK